MILFEQAMNGIDSWLFTKPEIVSREVVRDQLMCKLVPESIKMRYPAYKAPRYKDLLRFLSRNKVDLIRYNKEWENCNDYPLYLMADARRYWLKGCAIGLCAREEHYKPETRHLKNVVYTSDNGIVMPEPQQDLVSQPDLEKYNYYWIYF